MSKAVLPGRAREFRRKRPAEWALAPIHASSRLA